jgi:hypothetical protein
MSGTELPRLSIYPSGEGGRVTGYEPVLVKQSVARVVVHLPRWLVIGAGVGMAGREILYRFKPDA